MSSNLVSIRGCATLIDAAGHEYDVPLMFCTSFEQLKYMFLTLLQLNRSGASVQRRYIESGKFDFCIDDGKRVEQLVSCSTRWQNIGAGTTIVMRVIFEQMARFSPTYTCHLCGASNNLVSLLTDGSVDCHACKGRFQISVQNEVRVARSNLGNDLIDMETRHCIHNFCVSQIETSNSQASDYILMSNHYLQTTGEVHLLSWEVSQTEPIHQATHTAVAKLRGYPVSQGSATTIAIARQIAAYHFLKLRRQI